MKVPTLITTVALAGGAALLATVITLRAGADDSPAKPAITAETTADAVFAGGCFWCVESDFDKVDGVLETTSGYTGGNVDNPSYSQVTGGDTGHYEAVRIVYDPSVVSYETLVERFWHTVDPTDAGGQFCDRGNSYRTAIFVDSDDERTVAEATKAKYQAAPVPAEPIVTPILEENAFWPAEEYHQNYYKKNPIQYNFYRARCGRDDRIEDVWGK